MDIISDKTIIYIVSDSVGETAELVALAAASQFNHGMVDIRRVPYVNDPNEIPEIVEEAGSFNSIIAYTLVIPELRDTLIREAQKRNIPTVDIMTPMLDALSTVIHRRPKLEPGLVRRMDDE